MERTISKLSIVKYTLFYFFIICLSLSVLFSLFFLLSRTSNKIFTLQKRVKDSNCLLVNIISLVNEKKEAEKYRQFLNYLLPSEDNILFFDSKIKEVAQKNDLEINFNFGKIKEKDKLRAFPVEFSLTGREENVLNFFRDVKRMPFFFSIEEFKLNAEGENTSLVGSGLIFLGRKANEKRN